MYIWNESFKTFDDSCQPYGITVECSTYYQHKLTRITENGYTVSCKGNRYFYNVPVICDFHTSLEYSFSYLSDSVGFSVIFRYDMRKRHGLEIDCTFEDGKIIIGLYEISPLNRRLIGEKITKDYLPLSENKIYTLDFTADGSSVRGIIDGIEFEFFGVLQLPAGCIGFSRNGFVGEIILHNAAVSTEEINETVIYSGKVEIPVLHGGNIPFTLDYSTVKRNEEYYIDYKFDGGAQYRENYPYYPRETGQYCVEQARLTNPYVRVYYDDDKEKDSKKIYLKNGMLTTTDPELHWRHLLDRFFDITTLPLYGSVKIDGVCGSMQIVFGYDYAHFEGYYVQAGGPIEFLYDMNSKLIKESPPPKIDYCEVLSPSGKAVMDIIPPDCYDIDAVRKHFESNHYFAENERINFELVFNTKKIPEFITVTAELRDVYDDMISELDVHNAGNLHFSVAHAPLAIGCYRVVFKIYYGTLLHEENTVFEVFDETGKKCPPIESGLPFIFSMPNEQKYLDRDSFDPWNPRPSCNMEHYYACVSFTGDIAVRKKTWELTKPLGRSWYVWLSNHRTLTDYDCNAEDSIDIIKNADYIYYPVDGEWACLRHDLYTNYFGTYNNLYILDILNEFLDKKELREKIDYNKGGAIESRHITALHLVCMQEWYDYANKKITEAFYRNSEWLKSINPNIRRACYGPIPVYNARNKSYAFLKAFGYGNAEYLAKNIFTGFAQFEDYPSACAYQTYENTFAAMTLLLYCPELKLYPEQYKSSYGGCIDGAVFYAHPPVGRFHVPVYFNTTHAYEYVYNTAFRLADGFHYWKHRGFMRRDIPGDESEYFVRAWKHVVLHEPADQLKSTAFIADFFTGDDRYETLLHNQIFYNINEENANYLYKSAKCAGIPTGFGLKWDVVRLLSADETDLIIVPSTKNAPREALDALRELYVSGVSLFAISDIDGLEDIFGVAPKQRENKRRVTTLSTEFEKENIYPYDAEFKYDANGAEILLYADGEAVLFLKDRAALLNTGAASLGREHHPDMFSIDRKSMSTLLETVCKKMMLRLSSPIAVSDNCGISLFNDKNGKTLLLAIDYSPYGNKMIDREVTESTIVFNVDSFAGARSINNVDISALKDKNGILRQLLIKLRTHESAMIELYYRNTAKNKNRR